MRVGVVQVDVPLRVFDDDNCVIDHQAGRESNSKKRQRIDGEIKGIDKSESTNQRHWNGDRRNDGRTPIQQEEEDHNNDDDHRFLERSNNFFHRIADHRGRVESDYVLDAGRKRLRKLDERRLSGLVDLQRIGIRELLHTDAYGFVPTVQKVRVIAFRADFRAPNIFELHDPLAGVLDDDAFEFLRLREPSNYTQRHLKILLWC